MFTGDDVKMKDEGMSTDTDLVVFKRVYYKERTESNQAPGSVWRELEAMWIQ